ncbi:hypothetical protein D3C75_919200 [compost metagenome]
MPIGTLGVHGVRYAEGNLHFAGLGVYPGDFPADLLGQPQVAIRPHEHVMGVCQPANHHAFFKAGRDGNCRTRGRWAIGHGGHRHTRQVGNQQQCPRPGQWMAFTELFFKFPMFDFHTAPSASRKRKRQRPVPLDPRGPGVCVLAART